MSSQFDQDVLQKGKEIFEKIENESGTSIFNKDWWYGKVMEWSMRNKDFKTQMFRFVDVLPYLNSSSEVARHLKEYFAEGGDKLPSIFNFGAGLGSLAPGILATTVKKNVTQMAKMFITGEKPEEAIKVFEKLRKQNITFTADLLGEACLSESESLDYQKKYMHLIQSLAQRTSTWENKKQVDSNHLGDIPKVNVSVKLSALYSQIKVQAWEESKRILKDRLRPIFQLAVENHVFINLDLENYELKDLSFSVFKELILEPQFKDYPHWGVVVQAYLRDSYNEILQLTQLAKERQTPFTIRLVKGAYWDYETVDSEQKRWAYPVYTNKAECDANYEKCAFYLLENYQHIHTALGSHNIRSLSSCFVKAKELGVPQNALEVQMLYGMADDFKKALVNMGYRLRVYAPIGELIPGMAYLVRRLLENTSNESFLRHKFAEGESIEKLLDNPIHHMEITDASLETKNRFYNEALLDFTKEIHRSSMQQDLEASYGRYKNSFAIQIDGKKITTERELESINPSQPNDVVGKVYIASNVEADQAVKVAKRTFQTWRYSKVEERCQILERLADRILERRFELCSLQIRECGKTWIEADGDITEAIDFCRYYARDMRRLAKGYKVGNVPGEDSLYHYQARGVTAVIAPWNFPLAILTGMVTGALVTGNTVIMKPAEQSSITAALLNEMLEEVKCPNGVVSFLPGYGEEVGEFLVNHSDIANIAFTGSKEVGLGILQKANRLQPGQIQLKRCLVEMGGKNAIIIDSDADLDEAVGGVLYSAFAFAGQKCSACSRIIVLEEAYDRFIQRLVEAAKSIKVGSALNPDSYLGPVIDKESYERLQNILSKAKEEHTLLFQGEVPSTGYFVAPSIFTDVKSQDKLAQKEFFGPILAVLKAKNMEEALNIANSTEYALTGAVYSRSPANIEKIKQTFEVGNLYINRGSTGALVDRHPFGGFKLSGSGSKTGGPDYLLGFMEPRAIVENTLRRGFAPEEDLT